MRACPESLWKHAVGLGWLGIAAPEAFGGSGLDFGSLATIYEQLGRHLAPIPFLQGQLCIDALSAAGTDRQKRGWLEPMAAGSMRGTVISCATARNEDEAVSRRPPHSPRRHDTHRRQQLDRADRGLRSRCVRKTRVRVIVDRNQAKVELAPTKIHDGTRKLALASFNACEIPARIFSRKAPPRFNSKII